MYVGNLAFHTTEEQIYALFTKCGPLRRIIMGLDKNQMTPCGFCFVEYCSRRDTEECVKYLNGSRLDERDVRIDFDWCGAVPGLVHAARVPLPLRRWRRAACARLEYNDVAAARVRCRSARAYKCASCTRADAPRVLLLTQGLSGGPTVWARQARRPGA